MSYSPDRVSTVKLEASPSLGWNNCAAGPHRIAFSHKDSVYLLDARAVEGRGTTSLDKLVIRDPASHITGLSWGVVGGRVVLVVTSRAWFSVWDDGHTCIGCIPLSAAGVSASDTLANGYRTAIVLPGTDKVVVGTSWGAVLPADVHPAAVRPGGAGTTVSTGAGGATGTGGTVVPGPLLPSPHHVAITATTVDSMRFATGDDAGVVAVWSNSALAPLVAFEGAGHPVTSLCLRDEVLIAGYASGHVRIFHAADTAAASYMQVEMAAHARCITAMHIHPNQFTFATVGEDCMLNVWSLPEMSSGGKAKVLPDMSVRIADTLLTGVQFIAPTGRAGPPHIITTAYDSHTMRVFLGL